MINEISIIGSINSSTGKPDHSFLTWDLKLEQYKHKTQSTNNNFKGQSYTLYDRNSIPDDFLHTQQEIIGNLIRTIETNCSTQDAVNDLYQDFVSMMKREMNIKLKHKTKEVQIGHDNKTRKLKKTWWNGILTDLWNDACVAEKKNVKVTWT